MIGRTIAHYEITGKLGSGGMGEVYLANDRAQNRRVALKVLPEQERSDPHARERFLRGARAIARLSHPNIVRFYEVGEADGIPFLAMEYIEGRSLDLWMQSAKRPLSDIITIMVGIAEGLQAAHRETIVHRDLKPSNVIVDSEGRPRIVDFGIAKIGDATRMTRTGDVLGTFAYMSPEQTHGWETDARSDLFSLGIILYEAVAGRHPFEGEHPGALPYAIANEDPHPLARYHANVPDELERIVFKCLEKKPAARYQSTAELITDLTKLGEHLEAGQLPTKKRRQYPRVVGVGALLIIIAVGGVFAIRAIIGGGNSSGPERKMLAVLPLENLGTPDQESFADGLTEELISKLSSISGLGVISRTTAMAYKKASKSIPQIADELGVDYIMEGSVNWSRNPGGPDRLRVTTRLVDVKSELPLWDVAYDRSMSDALNLQAEVATKTANTLHISLLDSDRQNLVRGGSTNGDAIVAFIEGNAHFRTGRGRDEISAAIFDYEDAARLDSNFVNAFARLSRAHAKMVWYWGDDTLSTQKSLAKQALTRAELIDASAPETKLASGYYDYWIERDFDQALTQFTEIVRSESKSTEFYEVHAALAYVLRRRGEFKEALAHLTTALEDDPDRSARIESPRLAERAWELANTHLRLRHWAESIKYADVAHKLNPQAPDPYRILAQAQIYGFGNTDSAWATFARAPSSIPAERLSEDRVSVCVLRRDANCALQNLMVVDDDTAYFEIERSAISQLQQDTASARRSFEKARVLLERFVHEDSNYASFHSYLGIVYAGLGRAADAIREGKRALGILPPQKDAYWGGPRNLEALARIYATIGEKDAAVSALDTLLALPAGLVTPVYLRLAPEYDPLRGYPPFDALLGH
jgi:serine/threonine-protein kinase